MNREIIKDISLLILILSIICSSIYFTVYFNSLYKIVSYEKGLLLSIIPALIILTIYYFITEYKNGEKNDNP